MLSTDWTDGRTDGTTRQSAESDVKFHPEEQRGEKMCVGRMEGNEGIKEGERDNIPRKISTELLDDDELKVVYRGNSL